MDASETDAISREATRTQPVARASFHAQNAGGGRSHGWNSIRKTTRLGLKTLTMRMLRVLSHALVEERDFGHLFLLFPAFMIAGAAWCFSLREDVPAFRLYLWLGVLALLVWRARCTASRMRFPVYLAFCFAVGVASAEFQESRVTTVILDSPVTATVTGIVKDAELTGPSRWRYTLDVTAVSTPRLRRPPNVVQMTVRGGGQVFSIGETITGRARMQPPSGPVLPGLSDFAFSSFFKGVGAVGYFYGHPLTVAASSSPEVGWKASADGWIASVRGAITKRVLAVLPGDEGAFAAAIITNERSAFSKDALESLRVSGLAHIIAISGLHMALASGLFFVGLRIAFSLFPGFIQTYPAKKYAAAGALWAAGAYFLISGGPVSAERAFIMLCVMLGSVFVGRSAFSLRSVSIAAMFVTLWTPSNVVGPSFQMSFAAATALISAYSFWRLKLPTMAGLAFIPGHRYISPVIRLLGGIILTSAIGGLSTGLFAAAHFQRISLYGLAANLAAMPIISAVVMPAGLVAMLTMPFGLDRVPLEIMGAGLHATLAIARHVSSWGGNIITGLLAPWVLPTSSAAFLLAVLPRTRIRYAGAGAFVLILIVAFVLGSPQRPALIVSEDGELLAFVHRGKLAVNRARPAAFTFDQWQRALVTDGMEPPVMRQSVLERRDFATELTDAQQWQTEDAMEEAAQGLPANQFLCSGRDWCIGKLESGRIVITLRDPAFKDNACRQANIIIAATWLKFPKCGQGEGEGGALILDRKLLQQRGSLAIYEPERPQGVGQVAEAPIGPLTIRGALDGLDRPWNRHRYYDWRKGSFASPYQISDSGG